ncbi:hypothetical protein, partial [Citrobacter freundii]|uniref:hypothetical protein n=1 Tax=Citrobacter freundii TaxID=546 RepID=UPI001F154F2A
TPGQRCTARVLQIPTSTKQKCKKHQNDKTEIVIIPIKILNSHQAKLSPIPQLTYQRVHDV